MLQVMAHNDIRADAGSISLNYKGSLLQQMFQFKWQCFAQDACQNLPWTRGSTNDTLGECQFNPFTTCIFISKWIFIRHYKF